MDLKGYNNYYVDSIDLGDREATDEALAGTDFDRFIQADELDRWNLQRKDPWCVVGEHKQCPFGELDATPTGSSFPLFGDVETARLPWEAMFLLYEVDDGGTQRPQLWDVR